jgi:CubicO group peptidase (beta-lactamase class C family)
MFRIGSTSKTLTAYGAVRLAQRGALDIDAPIQRYVPSFPRKPGADITVRLLGGHLAGIRHYNDGELGLDSQYDSVIAALEIFPADDLVGPVAGAYHYSSYGWNLFGAAMEGAAQTPFLTLMEREVFRPLGLGHTVADEPIRVIAGRSGFYYVDPTTRTVVTSIAATSGREPVFYPLPRTWPVLVERCSTAATCRQNRHACCGRP